MSELEEVRTQRDRLRAALAALVGADGREELEQLEAVVRTIPAPIKDKVAMIDAIHALIDTGAEADDSRR